MGDAIVPVVIPGHREAMGPESITTNAKGWSLMGPQPSSNELWWLWIPGSMLRIAPE
ncbi:hypothetical protein [Bradyrhizobium sp. Ce-3]|uniref:hypothetical protein n=1 Tax=Bradyrhizobium sp. Ce-3 TaxID=2913970 RepID=UPI001FC7C499|nr:hypothetical protein [Bradyrhizobium sp. Ce-3]